MLLPNVFNNSFFDDDFMRFPTFKGYRDNNLMKSDVKDAGDHYELDVDLPGFDKDDVKLQLKDGVLSVEAATSTDNDEKDEEGKYIRRERFQGSCTRSFYVGEKIKQEDVSAKFDKGVLSINVPKESSIPEIEENNYIAIEG